MSYTQKWLAVISGLIVLAGIFIWVAPAKADHIDDMRNRDVATYCLSEVAAWEDGFAYRVNGAAKVIKDISKEEAQARHNAGEDHPLDGMYYFDWNNYTNQEKEWIQRNVFAGYDQAEMAVSNPALNIELVDKLKQRYYEQCLYDEAARRTNRDKMKETWLNKT